MREMAEERKWDGRTYGNGWMHRSLIGMLRHLDVRILYVFSYVFVIPPCMLGPGFKPIYHYFRQRRHDGPLKALLNTYRQHCMFAQVVIDRFAMYAGKHFEVEIEGYEHYRRLAHRPEAFIILSSHVGNYEIAGYSLTANSKRLNAVVYYGEKASVMENRVRMFARTNIHMIPVRPDMSHLFELNDVLERGETLSIPADRLFGSKKTIAKRFLGREADFPLGPFTVTIMRGLNALAVNVMKVKARKYKIYVTPLPYDKQAPRKEQTEQLSTAYVRQLEHILDRYPHQWYNFFEFWK